MRCICLILLGFAFYTCFAQVPSESRTIYTRKDGLSNNTVSRIIKDSRGFLWIGTSEGLNRFDGTHFISFFSDPGNNASLSGNNIFDLLAYRPGYLLIATNNGLSVLNTMTNTFENDKITLPALKKGSGVYVRTLFKDNQGRIYVNASGEIDVFSNDLRFIYRLTDTDWGRVLKGIIVSSEPCTQDSKGRIWLPSDNAGLCIIDEKERQVYSWKNNLLHYAFLRQEPVRSFFYDEEKEQVFVSYWGQGIEKYGIKTGQSMVQHFDIPLYGESRSINAITRKNDRLICCGSQGVYKLDPETMRYENLYRNLALPASSSFINCLTALSDSENTWIGTETKGLLQIADRSSFLEQIPLPYHIYDYTNFCTGILRTADNLLYFAYGNEGLVEMDSQSLEARHYTIAAVRGKTPAVYRISVQNDKEILVGSDHGFFLFDKRTKTFKRPSWLPAFTQDLSVSCLLHDSRGNLWVSFKNPNALGFYDAAAGQFHYYRDYIVTGKSIFDPLFLISRITEDDKGNIWMISYQVAGRMACYEPASHQWKRYPERAATAGILAGKELNSICITGNIVWTCNIYGLGLIRYDYGKDSLQRISRKDGLLSENILSISRDKNDNLFLSASTGIEYLNSKTNEIRTIIADDGNIDWGFSFTQYYDSTGNRLIYGLNDRIVIIKHQLWEVAASEGPVTYIDNIQVNNTRYPFEGRTIYLDHIRKNIRIDFTGINYNQNASVLYAYKMNGIDKDWNTGQQLTTVNYSNLSPGQYTFMIRARGDSGKWGPVNNSVHITVLPAFWQTAWFWVFSGLFVVTAITWLVGKRIRQVQKSAELKQKLAETEMTALRSQMNPHFIFNSLNAIDNLIQTNQADKATTYLARFARLIRLLLESSKNNVVPFHKDFETLQLYLQLEQFRANNKFSYDLYADQELLNGDYKVPPLIVQPFVENAIQHGLLNKQQGERKLSIHASLQSGFILYTISDNGVGRPKAFEIKQRNRPEQSAYGIRITAERLQLHNRDKKAHYFTITDLLQDGLAKGTKVEVRLKID